MIGLVADIHCANHRRHGGPVEAGLNRRCRQILKALEVAVVRAQDRDCEVLVVLGDLFDTTRPEPQIVRAVQRVFEKMPVYVLMGNHDLVSTAPGDHALGPLSPVSEVVEVPTWIMPSPDLQLLYVPFRPGPAVEWLPEVVKEAAPKRHHKDIPATMLLHLGLADDDTPAFMRGVHDAVPVGLVTSLCQEYGFKACFAGNWHYHKVLRKRPLICQVGCLAPTGWDNSGLEGHGTLVLWDGKQMEVEEIPGPRFLDVDHEDAPIIDEAVAGGHQLYVRCKVKKDQVSGMQRWLKDARAGEVIESGEVMLDDVEVRAAARSAATIARSADTLDEALDGFIRHMDLPEGVDRPTVLAKAKDYLGA